jgi:hypothetical protein
VADDLRANALINDSLGSALRSGDHALGTVPALLKRVLADETWREFVTKRGEHVEHERFADFVTTKPLRGLGSDVALVQRIVAGDKETLDLLDQALQRPVGHPSIDDNIHNRRTAGTSQRGALRRLRKDAPELHADVLAGRLSAHGAMVRAGFRPKTVTVPVTRPEAVAQSLLKHMTADDIAKLIAVLVGAANLSANDGTGHD